MSFYGSAFLTDSIFVVKCSEFEVATNNKQGTAKIFNSQLLSVA